MRIARRTDPLVQPDLFRPPTTRPVWEKLPLEVQKAVTRLLAQMMLDHRTHAVLRQQTKEAVDER